VNEDGRHLLMMYQDLRSCIQKPLTTGLLAAGDPSASYDRVSKRFIKQIKDCDKIAENLKSLFMGIVPL
jgi:hypothetical protein